MRAPRSRSHVVWLTSLLTIALVAASVVAFQAPVAQAATQSTWRKAVSSYDAIGAKCANILYIGVRGSGEHSGFGDTEDKVADGVQASMTAAKSTLTVRPVYLDYNAFDVSVLTNDVKLRVEDRLLGIKPPTTLSYFHGVDVGVTALKRVLADSASRCPNEKWVLAGYSQGALVVHGAMQKYADASHYAGVLLTADPANYPTNVPARNKMGSAPSGARGVSDMYQTRAPIPTGIQPLTSEYCNINDLVCDTNDDLAPVLSLLPLGLTLSPAVIALIKLVGEKDIKRGETIHGSYRTGPYQKQAGQQLGRQIVALVKPPTPTSTPSTPAISDGGLKTCVTAELLRDFGITTTVPTSTQIAMLSKLDCVTPTLYSVGSLDGLQGATSLASITAQGPMTDLTPVSKLPALTSVAFDKTGISSLAPFTGNAVLTKVSVQESPVTDVTPLTSLPNLLQGYFDGDQVYNISGLATQWRAGVRFSGYAQQMPTSPTTVGIANPLPTVTVLQGRAEPYDPSRPVPYVFTYDSFGWPTAVTWQAPGSAYLQWSDPLTDTCGGCDQFWYTVEYHQTVN